MYKNIFYSALTSIFDVKIFFRINFEKSVLGIRLKICPKTEQVPFAT